MKLGLAMIVKNESHIIKRCLDSVKDIIDYYIIIEDSLSSDKTVDIIRETLRDIPGEVIKKDWAGFANMRNYYIDAAKGKADYILVMDADQVLEINEGFDKNKLEKDVYNCIIKYADLQLYFPKIFKPSCGCQYKGIIHNYLSTGTTTVGTLDNIRFIDLHDGSRAMNYSEKIKKDIVILKEAIISDPEDKIRYTFYLAQSLRENEQYEEAIEYYQKRVSFGGWAEEIFQSLYQIGNCYEALQNNEKASYCYLTAYNYRPYRAESLLKLVLLYRKLGQYYTAYEFGKIGIKIAYPGEDILFIEHAVYDYLMLFEHSVSTYWAGEYIEAIKICNQIEAMSNIPEHIKELNIKNRQCSFNKIAEWSMGRETLNWIELNIPFGSTILELGSGKSTIDLAENYKVYSIEHNKKWLNLSSKSHYIYAPIVDGWYNAEILEKEIPEKYDLIIVDGPPAQIGRMGFYNNLHLFNTAIPILFDDIERPVEKELLEKVSEKLNVKFTGHYVEYTADNKKFAVINYKPIETKKCDVLFYDDVTTAFTSETWQSQAVGASILEASFLLTEIARSKKVMAFTKIEQSINIDNISWDNYRNCHNYECDTLIVFRYSTLPSNVKYKKLIVWVMDAAPLYHKHLFEALNKNNAVLVTLSEWQKSLFVPYVNNVKVIEFWLPNEIYDYKLKKDQNKYIYASANIKGLQSTIKYWLLLKENECFKEAKLYVCTPGYDEVDRSKLEKAGIIFLGSLRFVDVVDEIASAGAMFYVNNFPETFGMSPYLAEVLGCKIHLLCTKGFGALKEVLNSDLVTDNKDKFITDILDAPQNGGYVIKPKILTKDIQYAKWQEIIEPLSENNISNVLGLRNYSKGKTGLLSLITRLPKDSVMVEIGSYIGESTILFAQHCKKVYAIDIWENGYDKTDSASELYDMKIIEKAFDNRMKEFVNVIKIKGNSKEENLKFENNSLDFVYIDANHQYEHVLEDIDLWLSKIKVGGFIGGHDYGHCPGVTRAVGEIFKSKKLRVFEDTSWLITNMKE